MVKKKSKSVSSETSKDEFSIDFSGVKKIFTNFSLPKNKVWITVLLILIPILFSIYFRAYSYTLPITDDWAYNSIYNSIRAQVSGQINAQYPNLPTSNKNQLIDQQVSAFFQSNQASVSAQVNQMSQQLKANFQDDSGQTYLLAIDPYYFYRYSRNLLEKGTYGDTIIDDVEIDNHMLAPLGNPTSPTLHTYFQYYLHKFISIFSNQSLMSSVFLAPIIISALSVIPAFFIARRRAGYFGGFVAAMIVAIHASFIGRTAGGFSDTDAYNVLFPLLIAWLFIEAFETDNWKKRTALLSLNGLVVGIYSFAWSGWWYIFDFILGVMIAYSIFIFVKSLINKISWKDLRENLFVPTSSFIMFLISSAIFTSLISGFSVFRSFLTGPLKAIFLKQAAHATLWPNVYTTVAELNAASISSIISQIGGKFFFFIAGLGVLLTMIKKDDLNKKDFLLVGSGAAIYLLLITNKFIAFKQLTYLAIFLLPLVIGLILLLKDDRKIDVKYALFLTIWLVGTMYASTKGTRFILLMVPAFAIAFGIATGVIHSILSNLTSKEFNIKKKYVSVVFVILLLLLLVNPIKAAHNTAKGEIPSMSDAWWDSLTRIKDNSSENAIITSWWDFGHWFKAIADRPVTFDGGSQNSPSAHWVGKLLLDDDEDESVAILKMLDCGSNNAFNEINKRYDDTEKSVDLVYEIINLNKENAKTLLEEKGFNKEEITNITRYSHCDPPEAFLITSGDMVGKAGVWSHFGSWNFDRAFIYNNVKRADYQDSVELLKNRFDFSEEQASDYYYEVQSLVSDEAANSWIAPWPNYMTPNWRSCRNTSEEIVECNIGLNIGSSNVGRAILSGAIINISNPIDTKFIISFIDPNNGQTVAQNEGLPRRLIFAGETLETFEVGGTDLFMDIVYDAVNKRALVSHPDLSKSLFTKLFYLDGRYTKHFEKFSDLTTVTGSRIIVWKVKW